MNIEADSLKPRTLEDFKKYEQEAQTVKGTPSLGGSSQLTSDTMVQTRYNHYMKRRMQALNILRIRYDDMVSYGASYPQKPVYGHYEQEVNPFST